MKLSDWAREMGIGYQTAWRWFKEGKIEGAFQMPSGSGSIFVPEPEREPKCTNYNFGRTKLLRARRKP